MCHPSPDIHRLDKLIQGRNGTASRQVSFRLPYDDFDIMQRVADGQGIDTSAFIRRAILAALPAEKVA